MRTHLVIPDTQTRPDTPKDHLGWIGRYALEKKPDIIIQLGDHGDMPSLSYYDRGKLQFEGRRYQNDISAAKEGMRIFWEPIKQHNERQRKSKHAQYDPERHLTIGNHEYRIVRAVEDDPRLEGLMSIKDLGYEDDWTVHDYRVPVEIDGVSYCHFFYNPLNGRPYAGMIETRLKNIGYTFVQGHQQTYMIGLRTLNNGKRIRGLVCGSCYLHDEDYRGPQANGEWRGVFLLHEVHDGDFVLSEVSLDYLCRRYEGVGVAEFMKDMYPDIYNQSTWMQRAA